MDNVSRSYLITGFAAISAGAIALTPVQPVTHMAVAPQRAASTLGVELAATIDPIQPWVDLIQATVANTATITQQVFNPGPGLPILNALGSNLGVYLGELPNIGAIVNEILGNVKAGIAAPLDQNLDDNPLGGGPDVSWNTNNTTVVTCLFATNCGANGFTKFQTTGLLVNTPGFDELGPLINVLSSPLSGALVGFLSPGLSAFAQVIDSVNVVTTAVTTGNWAKALNEVINLPANLLNAYLNGGKQLDLTQDRGASGSGAGPQHPRGNEAGPGHRRVAEPRCGPRRRFLRSPREYEVGPVRWLGGYRLGFGFRRSRPLGYSRFRQGASAGPNRNNARHADHHRQCDQAARSRAGSGHVGSGHGRLGSG